MLLGFYCLEQFVLWGELKATQHDTIASEMKKTTKIVLAFSVLFILIAGLQVINFVDANPLPPAVIRIESPSNNQIYPSGEVWLNFTRLPDSDYVTSITYSLDDQTEITTNESNLLSGLSVGSHSLSLYAKMSTERDDYGYLITKIYFSINYSSSWLTFTAVLSAVFAVSLLMLFATRRQLVVVLKRKKIARFWVGLSVLLWGSLFFSLVVGGALYDYLFPVYHGGFAVILVYPSLIFNLFLIIIGLVVMKMGLKREKIS
jgi:hypothetical protein